MDQTNNNKRIAKNTAFLYLRMLFTTVLSLYAARLILKNLGVEDYGIYNVVGGIVTFMGFVTSSMSSATQRYLSYFLGQGEKIRLQQTFSLLVTVYLFFCLIALIILECAGPYYIASFMKVPRDRVAAAQIVFQFSLFTFLINTLSTPYRSILVAYEKMDLYACISIVEALLNISITIAIGYIDYDKLISFALLHLIFSFLVNVALAVYCSRHFEGSKYKRYWDKTYFKELLSYSGWNLFGSVTGVMNIQGQAIVLNYFFGPLVNAAKAIADKVNSLVTHLSTNFYMAVAPQIIKSYAAGNIEYMRSLVLGSSRYSFILMFVFSAPLYFIMEPVLLLWLGEGQVSFEMIRFSQFTIVYALVNVLEQPITMAVRATGDIKKYQVVVGSFTLLFLPLCVVLFWLGFPSYYSMILLSIIYLLALLVRIHMVSKIISVSILEYAKAVILPIVSVVVVDLLILFIVYSFYDFADKWVLEGAVTFTVTMLVCLLGGLKRTERQIFYSYLVKKLKK